MNPLQKALVVVWFVWAGVSSILIFARGGSWFEEGKNGFGLIWKYSPPLWRTITVWIAPLWLLALIGSFFF